MRASSGGASDGVAERGSGRHDDAMNTVYYSWRRRAHVRSRIVFFFLLFKPPVWTCRYHLLFFFYHEDDYFSFLLEFSSVNIYFLSEFRLQTNENIFFFSKSKVYALSRAPYYQRNNDRRGTVDEPLHGQYMCY